MCLFLAPFITYTRRKEGRKTKTTIASSLGSTKRRTFWLNVRTFRADVYPPTGQGNRVRWQQVPQARDTMLIRWWGVFCWSTGSSPSHFEIVSCYFTTGRRDNSSCIACDDGRIWQTHVAVASATLASSSCHELRREPFAFCARVCMHTRKPGRLDLMEIFKPSDRRFQWHARST